MRVNLRTGFVLSLSFAIAVLVLGALLVGTGQPSAPVPLRKGAAAVKMPGKQASSSGSMAPAIVTGQPNVPPQVAGSKFPHVAAELARAAGDHLPSLNRVLQARMGPVAAATPRDTAALGSYDVLIADEGNDRLLIVNPQKKILWKYRFHGTKVGADDAFFTDHGKQVIVNLEHSQFLEKVDIASHKPVWQYGRLGYPGSTGEEMYFPDDAYQMPDGNVIVADIRNCRIIEISPDKRIIRQAGKTGNCSNAKGTLRSPNGDTPLSNGDMLVSEIQNNVLTELGPDWKPRWSLKLPIRYPSDPQPTKNGNYVIAGYTNPGKIIIISKHGRVIWRDRTVTGRALNHPSLAEQLPDGNIMATDDLNDRVIVIDRKTGRVLWQYGVTGVGGSRHGYLREPDGFDIIPSGMPGRTR